MFKRLHMSLAKTMNRINHPISSIIPNLSGKDKFKNKPNFVLGEDKPKDVKYHIGQGFYHSKLPELINRQVLQNPSWYTAYTPYQAEISQGRLELIHEYQEMVKNILQMDVSNAGLLDEATSASEIIGMTMRIQKKETITIFASNDLFFYTKGAIENKVNIHQNNIIWGDEANFDYKHYQPDLVFIQYPNKYGIFNPKSLQTMIENIRINSPKTLIAISTDLLFNTLFEPVGIYKPDFVFGSNQRFGLPLGFGGPHSGVFATKKEYLRNLPGKLVGKSIDKLENPIYRMALQTREQHIKKSKATSNICTSQILLSNISALWAMYHGRDGIQGIARDIYNKSHFLESQVRKMTTPNLNYLVNKPDDFFDTISFETTKDNETFFKEANQHFFHHQHSNKYSISINETDDETDLNELKRVFFNYMETQNELCIQAVPPKLENFNIDIKTRDLSTLLPFKNFNSNQTEHQLTRYIHGLVKKDYTLVDGMIPLGSCTMKLNSVELMKYIHDPLFSNTHPFSGGDNANRLNKFILSFKSVLKEITGLDEISFQPTSGSMGEWTALLTVRNYLAHHNKLYKKYVLIPSSAHGTNFASAQTAGFDVLTLPNEKDGSISIDKLNQYLEKYKDKIAVFMITYPSTYGFFDENIMEISKLIKANNIFMYMDGANMNAVTGFFTPADVGADMVHLNLHKTFCIPHGGGGPGMGPIGVSAELAPFLPSHPFDNVRLPPNKICHTFDKPIPQFPNVSTSPYGSASILPIPYFYCKELGLSGLKEASQLAVDKANFLKDELKAYYRIPFVDKEGRCSHEFIIDCSVFKDVGIKDVDFAKRLMDYSFHAPTMSWPLPNSLMIEPTESEDEEELMRFVKSMIEIRNEIEEIREGKYTKDNNVLVNAPHGTSLLEKPEWLLPYSQQKAFYPLPEYVDKKYWFYPCRVNDVYGDKILLKN